MTNQKSFMLIYKSSQFRNHSMQIENLLLVRSIISCKVKNATAKLIFKGIHINNF